MKQKTWQQLIPIWKKINEAWKNASEEMYKAQAEGQSQAGPDPATDAGASADGADDVQDVDFEEVK